jgi:hypothetical protein
MGVPSRNEPTFEDRSLGGTNSQATHDANVLMGAPSRYEPTFEDCSRGGIKAAAQLTFDDRSRGGTKIGGNKGKGGGNKPGCGEGSHSASKTETGTTQLNYLEYCASDAGKAKLANRNIHTAPDHYLKLLKLKPPLHFMNASGKNKARVTFKNKQSKK